MELHYEDLKLILPTPRVIHKEIGLPLKYIADAFQCSRNTLNKYLDELPDPLSVYNKARKNGHKKYKILDYVKSSKDINDILALYDSAIHNYKAADFKSGTAAEMRWEQERAKFRTALEVDLNETKKLNEYLKKASAEIGQYRKENSKGLFEQCKREYSKLSTDIALKIAYYYDAYIKLFYLITCKPELILSTLSIMVPEAKQEISKQIDDIKLSIGHLTHTVSIFGEAIYQWGKIREGSAKLRKNTKDAQKVFENRFEHSDYEEKLYAATLIHIYSHYNISDDDMDIAMKCAYFMSGGMKIILGMATPENLGEPNDKKDYEKILALQEIGNPIIRLEHYLGIKSEDELGI